MKPNDLKFYVIECGDLAVLRVIRRLSDKATAIAIAKRARAASSHLYFIYCNCPGDEILYFYRRGNSNALRSRLITIAEQEAILIAIEDAEGAKRERANNA
jgi:hypothetical protein